MARKCSASVTHVKNVVKTRCFYPGLSPKIRQHQNCSDKNVTSVVKMVLSAISAPPPVVHPVASNSNGNTNVRDEHISRVEQTHVEVEKGIDSGRGLNLTMAKNSDHNDPSGHGLSLPNQHTKHIVNQQVASESDPEYRVSVNTTCANDPQLTDQFFLIYDVNHAGVEEKFVNSIMHFNQFSDHIDTDDSQPLIFQQWPEQILILVLYH